MRAQRVGSYGERVEVGAGRLGLGWRTTFLAAAMLAAPGMGGLMEVEGAWEVSPSGAAGYELPLPVPPGVNDVEPRIGIRYDSQAGNGLLGMRWTLSGLSAIVRCPRTVAQDGIAGSVNFDGDDRFCLDGQRLVVISGRYGADLAEYRTERDVFSRVVSYGSAGGGPAYFRVWAKDGRILEYGGTADSRIEAQGKDTVRLWAMNRLADRSGNFLVAVYAEDNARGEYYPIRMEYGGHSGMGLSSDKSVRFEYEPRGDVEAFYTAGALEKRTVRLQRIVTYHKNAAGADMPVTRWHFRYDNGATASRTRLVDLRACDGSDSCLPAVQVRWARVPEAFSLEESIRDLAPDQGYGSASTYPVFSGDWDGDGKTDIGRVSADGIRFFLAADRSEMPGINDFAPRQGYVDGVIHPVLVGDWNGDGKSDFAQVTKSGTRFYVSSGTGWSTMAVLDDYSPAQGFSDSKKFPFLLGDWNGDGRTDIGRVTATGIRFHVSTGTGWVPMGGIATLSPAQGFSDGNTYPVLIGDWNGDGKSDIARVTASGIEFHVSSGTGWTRMTGIGGLSPAQGFSDANAYPVVIGDWNGDGRTDIGRVSATGIVFFFATGVGWANAPGINGDLARAQGFVNGDVYPVLTGDWNGDGKTDVARVTATGVSFYVSEGTGWSAAPGIKELSPAQGFTDGGRFPIMAGDWSGSGRGQISRVSKTGVRFQLYAPQPGDVVTSVLSGLGASTTFGYEHLTNREVYTKDAGPRAGNYPVVDLHVPLPVVSRVIRSNGGSPLTTRFRYGGLKAESGTGRGALGFRWTESTDDGSGITSRTEFRQDWPYSGMRERERKIRPGSGKSGELLTRDFVLGCLDPATGGACTVAAGRRYFPHVARSVESAWDLSGAAFPPVTTTNDFDQYGSLTRTVISTGDGHRKVMANTFVNDAKNWILGRLVDARVESTAP